MVFKKIREAVAALSGAILISLTLLACSSVNLKKENKEMKQQETALEAFQIIGIKTRTTNSEEMKGAGKISALWTKFYAEEVLNKIPGKLDQDVVSIYHDYESDASAPYSVIIGARVAPGTKASAGLELVSIPAQKYFKLTTAPGEMPGVIFGAWKNVWDLTAKSELNRKYSYDIEVYDARAANPKSAVVDLLIAIK